MLYLHLGHRQRQQMIHHQRRSPIGNGLRGEIMGVIPRAGDAEKQAPIQLPAAVHCQRTDFAVSLDRHNLLSRFPCQF